MKQYSRVVVAVLVVVVACVFFAGKPFDKKPIAQAPRVQKVSLAGQVFMLEIADTEMMRERGLSGRDGLGQNEGMLFVFDQPDRTCFWMKDMKFPIDILWFDQDANLVNVKSDATPESFPESFCSPALAKYAVELPAGTVKRIGLKSGSEIKVSEQ